MKINLIYGTLRYIIKAMFCYYLFTLFETNNVHWYLIASKMYLDMFINLYNEIDFLKRGQKQEKSNDNTADRQFGPI